MAQRRDSAEVTRQKDVAPGDSTGTYYITLCNLPFGTSWQELKDFTRTACEVEHVEVFRTSTSGWVRVNGRANFDKAWQLLNGGHFNGRSIIASDRNRSQPIKIKELVDGSPDTTALGQPLMQYRPAVSPPTLATCGQDKSRLGAYPYAQLGNHRDRPIMISDYRTSDSTTPPGDNSTEDDFFSHYEAYDGHCDQYRMSWDHDVQHGAMVEHYPDTSMATSGQYETSTCCPADGCRIVVTGFPRKASSDDITLWIRRALGHHASFISRIDGPVNYSKTAYVSLSSSAVLRTSIEALHYQKYQERTIKAKMAKENTYNGGSEGKSSTGSSKSSQSPKSSRQPLSKSKSSSTTCTKGLSSTEAKSSGQRKVDRSRSVGGVLIVDGTTDQGCSAR